MSNIQFHALILAGGNGSRLGGDSPKQYQKISSISIIEQCIKTFSSCQNCASIRLVCDPKYEEVVQKILCTYKIIQVSQNGLCRKDSVYNGLKDLSYLKSEDIVLVHDAARPLIELSDIENLIEAVSRTDAATLAVPVSDTLTRLDGTAVDRQDLWAVQTPQGFRYNLLCRAHEKFRHDNSFTDDAGLVRAFGYPVQIVPGKRQNFKITTPDDLEMARKMMNSADTDIRTALGFDVHAFDPAKPGPIRLGGVDIPHHCRLLGHSDADVGLHVLTDALLGTIAAGDIGLHFPPSDPQWKDADSGLFLKHAVKLVRDKGGRITLLDLTFMCEAPKIGPVREVMQAAIAALTGLTPDRVSIKATTTEKLGFTGRGEGIAAQALATVQFSQGQT